MLIVVKVFPVFADLSAADHLGVSRSSMVRLFALSLENKFVRVAGSSAYAASCKVSHGQRSPIVIQSKNPWRL